ncbi:MAG: hypothetical protein M1829_002627 [Trizodia sp. TS-e1964]|nr:MAG: hypothetical protein M1829_002627 [Trizodia sp. TS-e1964]
MADPLSIIAGTVGICDVCWRVYQYLKDVREASSGIQGEIDALQRELSSLQNVNKALRAIYPSDRTAPKYNILTRSRPDDKEEVSLLWQDVAGIQEGCKTAVEDLERLLEDTFAPLIKGIVGAGQSKVTGKIDGLKKQLRRQSKTEELGQFRLRLANYQGRLQVLLTALNISYTCDINGSAEQLTEDIQRLGYELQSQITSLRQDVKVSTSFNLGDCPSSASALASLLSFNKFFDTPRPVSSLFTGRSDLLKRLGDAIFSPEQCHTQRRFVIYGLGGSGKTEFCCKFAQDHQQLFWGVFWLDAATPATVKSTFALIAQVGGVEPNPDAAKSWLSSLDHPWLLLIENANGDESGVNLPDLFPEGRRGIVLVTTRNSSYRTHGTVGCRWLEFSDMEADEADELLLRAASIQSRDVATRKEATAISKILGFLPLALVHAGKAILDGLCTLNDYVAYFWRFLDRVRKNTFDDEESNMRVYSTYEILLLGLESKRDQRLKGYIAAGDAVELLKVFSFLSCENIPLDVLVKAVENSRIEQDAEKLKKKEQLQGQLTALQLPTWTELLQKINLLLNFEVLKETPPVLPAVLREYDIDRLRKALTVLAQLALITHHDVSDHYSMHPLVHIWSRYRPEMRLREQAVWCQAAATTLAQCVLLPPLGMTKFAVGLRLQLIPHVTHVLKCQEDINLRFKEQRRKRNKLWPLFGDHKFSRADARMYAKFSMVYAQGGMWTDAERLQRQVKDFVFSMMGSNHPVAVDIMLALSGSLMNQTRANEAAELQKQALEASTNVHGPEHPKTLMVMCMLATSYIYGGRFQAAFNLYDDAIEKLTRTKGSGDEDTLRAVDGLGRLMMRYQRHEDAESLHEKAAMGLEKALGQTNLDTLSAKAGLAMAKLQLKGDKIPAAYELIELVYEERKKQLGKEHPLTLLAICDFARIKAALDMTEEAEEMMLSALAIAKRNLGKDHQGVLMGMAHLANLYVQIQRYQEAEDLLLYVIQPDKYIHSVRAEGEHPDRIAALWYLMNCYSAQGKNKEALNISHELSKAIENCGGEGLGKNHNIAKTVLKKRKELEAMLNSAL